jgi:enterochelin esterase-like enzyme
MRITPQQARAARDQRITQALLVCVLFESSEQAVEKLQRLIASEMMSQTQGSALSHRWETLVRELASDLLPIARQIAETEAQRGTPDP